MDQQHSIHSLLIPSYRFKLGWGVYISLLLRQNSDNAVVINMTSLNNQWRKSFSALLGSTRLNLALVGFLGCVVAYALRSDVSFAIVCMVNTTAAAEVMSGVKNNVTKEMACDRDHETTSQKDSVVYAVFAHLLLRLGTKYS